MSTTTLAAVARRPWPRLEHLGRDFGKLEYERDGDLSPRWRQTYLKAISLPYRMRLAWAPDIYIQRLTCHKMVAQSLSQVLAAVRLAAPEAIEAAGLDLFGGCQRFELERDGRTLSAHAFGMAIDLNPEANPPGKRWQEGEGMMPPAVVEIFEQAGWRWGGRNKRWPDCAHFEAVAG